VLPQLTDHIVFDRWPKMGTSTLAQWGLTCLRRLRRAFGAEQGMFASARVAISIVPKDIADTIPFTLGQCAEPRDRFSYIHAIERPHATARMLLGPRKYYMLKAFIGFWLVVTSVLLIALTVYYSLQVKSQVLGSGSSRRI